VPKRRRQLSLSGQLARGHPRGARLGMGRCGAAAAGDFTAQFGGGQRKRACRLRRRNAEGWSQQAGGGKFRIGNCPIDLTAAQTGPQGAIGKKARTVGVLRRGLGLADSRRLGSLIKAARITTQSLSVLQAAACRGGDAPARGLTGGLAATVVATVETTVGSQASFKEEAGSRLAKGMAKGIGGGLANTLHPPSPSATAKAGRGKARPTPLAARRSG
jgi:hypothetical protein